MIATRRRSVDVARIRAVTFDGDDTLWDVRAAARVALASVADTLNHDYADDLGSPISVDELAAARERLAAAADPTMPMAEIRRASFAAVLAHRSVRPQQQYLDEVLARFLDERLACTICYPDVLPALRTLGERYPLGLITNGNTPPARIELTDMFDYVHMSETQRLWKPDPRVWTIAAAGLGVPVEAVLHVGDNPVEDYDAARRAGCNVLLLCRTDARARSDAATVTDLAGVIEFLGR